MAFEVLPDPFDGIEVGDWAEDTPGISLLVQIADEGAVGRFESLVILDLAAETHGSPMVPVGSARVIYYWKNLFIYLLGSPYCPSPSHGASPPRSLPKSRSAHKWGLDGFVWQDESKFLFGEIRLSTTVSSKSKRLKPNSNRMLDRAKPVRKILIFAPLTVLVITGIILFLANDSTSPARLGKSQAASQDNGQPSAQANAEAPSGTRKIRPSSLAKLPPIQDLGEIDFTSGQLPRRGDALPQKIRFRSASGMEVGLLLKKHDPGNGGGDNWTGSFEDEPDSTFAISIVNNAVHGYGMSDAYGELQFSGSADGSLKLQKLNLEGGFCQSSEPEHRAEDAGFGEGAPLENEADATLQSGGFGPIVDILVVYTPLALQEAGSVDAVTAKANAMISSLTNYLVNGQINVSVNLLGVAPVSYSGGSSTSDGSVNTLLSRLSSSTDRQMDEAHAYRETYGADLVCVFGKATNFGIASIGGAWSAADYSTASGVMPHEIGHNLGCGHNDSGTGQQGLRGVYSYSYGHYIDFPPLRGTLMSYIGGRSGRFSNPDVLWSGQPSGTASRDHARSINNFGPTAAGWKTSNPDDYDRDGLPNSLEAAGDEDGDGLPNILDTDSDDDGILDGDEAASDLPGINIVARAENLITGNNQATNTIPSFQVIEGSNRKLVVAASWEAGGGRITGISFLGGNFTEAVTQLNANASSIWYLDNPTVGTGNIVVTFGGITNDGSHIGVLSLRNAAPGVRLTHGFSGNTSSYATAASNSLVVEAYSANANTVTPAIPAGLDALYLGKGYSAHGGAGSKKILTASAISNSWSSETNRPTIAAAEFLSVDSVIGLTWNNSATTGNWNTTAANWTGLTWDNANPDSAIFKNRNETVTLTEAITGGHLAMSNDGRQSGNHLLTLAGSQLSLGTLSIDGEGSGNVDTLPQANNQQLGLSNSVTTSGNVSLTRASLAVSPTGALDIGGQLIGNSAWNNLIMSPGSTVTIAGGIDFKTIASNLDFSGGTLTTSSIWGNNHGGETPTTAIFNGTTVKASSANADFLKMSNSTDGAAHSGTANLAAGGLIFDTNGFAVGIANVLTGNGGLTKLGGGTLTLEAINTYTGSTNIKAGTLSVGGKSIANASTIILNGGKLGIAAAANETVNELFYGAALQTAGTYGSTASSASVKNDSRFSGSGILTVMTGAAMSDYNVWLGALTFAPGANTNPAGDADGDGLSNMAEFAFGLDPTKSSSANPVTVPLEKTAATLTYTRRKPSLTGLIYKVWTSSDLSTWEEDTAATQAATDVGENQNVLVTLSAAPLRATKTFVRISAQ